MEHTLEEHSPTRTPPIRTHSYQDTLLSGYPLSGHTPIRISYQDIPYQESGHTLIRTPPNRTPPIRDTLLSGHTSIRISSYQDILSRTHSYQDTYQDTLLSGHTSIRISYQDTLLSGHTPIRTLPIMIHSYQDTFLSGYPPIRISYQDILSGHTPIRTSFLSGQPPIRIPFYVSRHYLYQETVFIRTLSYQVTLTIRTPSLLRHPFY